MKPQLAGDLMTAIASLPDDHFVTIGKEQDEEERWFLAACVSQKAPKDGWPSRGARFRDPPTSTSHKEPCPPQWEHDDAAIFCVSADPAQPEALERLLINAIQRRTADEK